MTLRAKCLILASISFFCATQNPSSSAEISDTLLTEFLDAGSWSSIADEDLDLQERLPIDLARRLASGSEHDLGLLVLSTSVAKWGVSSDTNLPSDPASDQWRGPRGLTGKHLMSYKVGGVGLPHADRGYLADFIRYLRDRHPEIGNAEETKEISRIEKSLRDSGTFDQWRKNPSFLHWMKSGLQTKDGQQWILEQWLTRYWEPSYSLVVGNGGSIDEALINARIRNTSSRLANCTYQKSRQAKDPVEAELEAYANPKICPGAKHRYKEDRWGWMRRPVVLYHLPEQ